MVVGEADIGGALAPRAEPDHRLLDLAHHRARADEEAVARLRARVHALGCEGVVHDHEVIDVGRALHRAELGVLLAQLLDGFVHLALLERLGRVLDTEAGVLAQLDGGLDLHERFELERRAFLERHFLEVGLLHRLELGLLQRLAVHVGNEVAGHFLADVVGEVELDHAPRHLALAKAGELGFLLDAIEGLLPRLAHDVRGFLDLQAALAGANLFNGDFHAGS